VQRAFDYYSAGCYPSLAEGLFLMRSHYSLALVFAVVLTGCETLGMPNWCNPPPASYQREKANQFDPYPDPYIAPPILGGRPPGAMEPRQEPNPIKHQFVPGHSAGPYTPAY
jgi:hypothetical protein